MMLRRQKSFGTPTPKVTKSGNNFTSLTQWLNQTDSRGTLNVDEPSYQPVRSISNLDDHAHPAIRFANPIQCAHHTF